MKLVTISEVPLSDNNDHTEYEEIIIIHPDDVKNFEQITLEYQGYCAWFCTTGVLLPSKRYLGIVMYKGLCYGFSSEEAMESFKVKPNECIAATRNYMMIMPEFIITLRMEALFQLPIIYLMELTHSQMMYMMQYWCIRRIPFFRPIFKEKSASYAPANTNNIKFLQVRPIFISDCSVQTILHPTETNIDYTYNWNQWNLRKQAIKYADLVNRRTHSTKLIQSLQKRKIIVSLPSQRQLDSNKKRYRDNYVQNRDARTIQSDKKIIFVN
ncbi:cilia- and flagella-associated protein 206-like isoform X3 [Stegodyphus dumicola]|uniref:cilia- and flagella-associated protein 206-like isoform X3 n=1 Tax=Stegodyphus dumicola TaxID=202533 RepID=UPI0015AC7D64|nr:cilia- and flagella-associated protein 206-like isoform X3 [Stegodyphus dumicola]